MRTCHLSLFILLQLITWNSISQEIEMSGIIINNTTQQPIEYVNIGVLNKNQGAISNPKGKFTLTVSKKFETDSITISHINYYPIKLPVENFKNKTIFLEPKTTELSEVVVSNKKRRTRKIGVKSFNRFLSIRTVSEKNDIIEVAQRINIPSKEIKVKTVNFNIRKWSEIDGLKIRINFYININNAPGEKLIQKNIIKEIPPLTSSGWISIDLEEYDIYISEDFFVGIEFIPNFSNSTIVDMGAILTKGKGYRRINSLGTWGKLNGGASINVEIKY